MKILIFTEGTIIMHKSAEGHTREEIVRQSQNKIINWIQWALRLKGSVSDYESYIPIGDAPVKLKNWKKDGAEIFYLTSRRNPDEIQQIQKVLKKYIFPEGQLLFRRKGEEYKDIAERVIPHVLVEDDCESIGGIGEMAITHIKPEIKKKIRPIEIKEFGGIGHLPDTIHELLKY